ncbi:hypothetical protein CPY53_17830 [Paenibacillus polymyxa]|nr:transposase [Paenibacillus polymyxa]PNQ85343.1 hypothetical protein C1T20_13725 [Paenibacillus polymyxa]UNL95272.1 hypothetical protein CPY53_17830 [Paenibacillus polymyxa]
MYRITVRDAVHVIDGLLHHETDLAIEVHYTDTAGYTDQVFGFNEFARISLTGKDSKAFDSCSSVFY